MFAAVVATIALLVLPGLLTSLAGGLRPVPALAAAAPVTVGIAGWSVWLAGFLGVEWRWWSALAAWAVVTLIAGAVAAISLVRHRRAARAAAEDPSHVTPIPFDRLRPAAATFAALGTLAVTIASACWQLIALHRAPGGAGGAWETWDGLWHATVLRFARDTGVASPTRMGELMHPGMGVDAYYPTGWHALAALVPADAITTVNVFGLLAPALAAPAAAAWLAWHVAGPRFGPAAAPVAALGAAAAPALLTALTASASIVFLLAAAMAPAVLVLLTRGPVVPAVVALVGLATVHPAVAVATFTCAVLWMLADASAIAAAHCIGAGVLALVALVPIGLAAYADPAALTAMPAAAPIDRAQSLWWALAGHSPVLGDDGPLLAVQIVITVLAVAGIIAAAVVRRRALWLPVAWLLFAGLTAVVLVPASGGVGDVLADASLVFGGLPHHLLALATLARVQLAALGLAAVIVGIRTLVRRSRRGKPDGTGWAVPVASPDARGRALVAAVIAIVAVWVLTPVSGDFAKWAVREDRTGLIVTDADRAAWAWLSGQPGAGATLVLDNPAEASGWMYPDAGLRSVTAASPWPQAPSPMVERALAGVDLAGVDPDVDKALAQLGASYVFVSPPSLSEDASPALASRSWAWWSPGLTPIYADGSASIFAVNAAFTGPEIEGLLARSPHRPGAPSMAVTPPRQPVVAPPAESADPLAGAIVQVMPAGACDPGPDKEALVAAQEASAQAATAVNEELARRGAIVVDAMAADVNAPEPHVDLTVCQRIGEAAPADSPADVRASGFRVTTLVPGEPADPAAMAAAPPQVHDSLVLAASLRDSLAAHGVLPDEVGAVSGLAPAGVPPQMAAALPTMASVIVDLGWRGTAWAPGAVEDPRALAAAFADGVAALLRQNPGLKAAQPDPAPAPDPAATGR